VVEHLEDHASRWISAEYEHARKLVGTKLVITNAGRFCDQLSRIVGGDACFRESILELMGRLYQRPEKVIVLDPRAARRLEPHEAAEAEAIVVGGILGDHPPRGRTWSLLTEKAARMGMKARNLGPRQLSIDGAVYVAHLVAQGTRLEDVELVENPSIEIELGDGLVREVVLPFAYPVVNGKPLIYEKVVRLLRGGLGYEEYLASRQ